MRILLRLFARFPLPLVHAMGALLGGLFYLIPNRHRRVTLRNLELCFPDQSPGERKRLARRSLIESGKTMTETIVLWLGDAGKLQRLARRVSGEELLDQAMAEGRGVILVSPHIGSWEYVGMYCASRYPMTCMYRPPRHQGFEIIVREGRGRAGISLAPTDAGGIRVLMQTLRRGELVGILPDQDPRDSGGTFAPFFGIPANTITLLSRLAAKTGATMLFGFAERLPAGQGFHLHFLLAPVGSENTDPELSAAAINKGVENCVKITPEQYQWSYKRFRTRPEGEDSIY